MTGSLLSDAEIKVWPDPRSHRLKSRCQLPLLIWSFQFNFSLMAQFCSLWLSPLGPHFLPGSQMEATFISKKPLRPFHLQNQQQRLSFTQNSFHTSNVSHWKPQSLLRAHMVGSVSSRMFFLFKVNWFGTWFTADKSTHKSTPLEFGRRCVCTRDWES